MLRAKVGVLRGGPSSEYDVSLKTGGAILQHLDTEKYEPVDVFIDRQGRWHARGLPKTPGRIIENLDLVINALHGHYGEDGQVQRILESYRVPYTGSDAVASAVAMNKALTKERLGAAGIKMPRHRVFEDHERLEEELFEFFRTAPQPSVVKPLAGGSSVGVTVADNFGALLDGVAAAFEEGERVLIEEHIKGREATCGVLERFRGQEHYTLLPVEIVPAKNRRFFDYDAKYAGESEERCPGNFTTSEKDELARLARVVHEGLGLRHYSRSDFIVSPRGIYFLETNTLPGLTEQSLVPKSLEAAGCSFSEFVEHLIELALERR